jgi:hypothetical protein
MREVLSLPRDNARRCGRAVSIVRRMGQDYERQNGVEIASTYGEEAAHGGCIFHGSQKEFVEKVR